MNLGLKNVYFLFFVKKPRSRARLKSDMALFKNPACLASSLDIREKISATAQSGTNHWSFWIAYELPETQSTELPWKKTAYLCMHSNGKILELSGRFCLNCRARSGTYPTKNVLKWRIGPSLGWAWYGTRFPREISPFPFPRTSCTPDVSFWTRGCAQSEAMKELPWRNRK